MTTLVLGLIAKSKKGGYALHLKAKAPTGQGVYQWCVTPNDSKDCDLFVEKYPVSTKD